MATVSNNIKISDSSCVIVGSFLWSSHYSRRRNVGTGDKTWSNRAGASTLFWKRLFGSLLSEQRISNNHLRSEGDHHSTFWIIGHPVWEILQRRKNMQLKCFLRCVLPPPPILYFSSKRLIINPGLPVCNVKWSYLWNFARYGMSNPPDPAIASSLTTGAARSCLFLWDGKCKFLFTVIL